ncbi:MAG: prepilin-type N-terminal cleavage/methylation domain-containing protein [Alphaproteobacteria bacterium]|nr:prepilin-type N-terminal cleavage/methylation domain-containing protein [Alphaproteobacteria bacterium]
MEKTEKLLSYLKGIGPFLSAALRRRGSEGLFSSGFTLVEMAVVMVVMGMVAMTVFPALTTLRQANQLALTQSNLRSLMIATAAFVQANGCLPCPAIPGETGTDFGKLGYSDSIACGTCDAPQGIPPFASLGIPASVAHDGWGHWITMRVDPALTNPEKPVPVPPTAPCTASDVSSNICSQLGASAKGLCKAGYSSADRIKVTNTGGGGEQQAAVIFISHGSTGYGSYVATPKYSDYLLPFASNYAECSPYGGYAQCNSAERNTAQYYDAPAVIGDTDSYDDVLAYADRNTLVSMLGNGACNTAW